MKFFIPEWNEYTIVLMTEKGHVLAYFSSTEEAFKAWLRFTGNVFSWNHPYQAESQ